MEYTPARHDDTAHGSRLHEKYMINVYPLDEDHTLDTTCWCGPQVDFDLPEILVVHNSNTPGKWICEPDDLTAGPQDVE